MILRLLIRKQTLPVVQEFLKIGGVFVQNMLENEKMYNLYYNKKHYIV